MTASPLEIFAIFALLGTGLAAPYLLIALWPHLASALPRPGQWMITLTRILGFGMAGTAAWLLFVLQAQVGLGATVSIAAGMAVLLFFLYLRHRNVLRWFIVPIAMLVIGGSCSLAVIATVPPSLTQEAGAWETFDATKIDEAVSQGKTVFVDITADWCLTCKYNKRFVLAQEIIAKKLFDKNSVMAMQADWTNPDPAITAYLHRYGRYGIPFNAVYGPRAPQGILLPELLTSDIVLNALKKAGPAACAVDLPPALGC
jgi:suppressor for copper-sensitivity B